MFDDIDVLSLIAIALLIFIVAIGGGVKLIKMLYDRFIK
jgi:hypothetical protein